MLITGVNFTEITNPSCFNKSKFIRPQKTLKNTKIKLYNTLAIPILLYVSETWIIKVSGAIRITAAEMKYMRRTSGYTWADYKTNDKNCKGFKNNTNFLQTTGIQEELDAIYKENASK